MKRPIFAEVDTLAVAESWTALTDLERMNLVNGIADRPEFQALSVVRADCQGQVYACLDESVGASSRGTLLLDFEAALKSDLDVGLVVWVDPLDDRNRLRHLRGVTVKII